MNDKKYCSSCGKEINLDAKFCPLCGKEQRSSFEDIEETPVPSSPNVQYAASNDISGGLKAFGILNIIFGSITTLAGLGNIARIGTLGISDFYKVWIVFTFLSSIALLAGGIGILTRKKTGRGFALVGCYWLLAEHAIHVIMAFLIMADKKFFRMFVPSSVLRNPFFRGTFGPSMMEFIRVFSGIALIILGVGLGCYYFFQLRSLNRQASKYK